MNKMIFALFSFPLFALAAAPKDFESNNKLVELWQNEEIYFAPKDKDDPMSWAGVMYHYSTKKCYELKQDDDIVAIESKCDPSFLVKANEPYTKISDFEKYKAQLLKCFETSDQKCIRGLVSKTLQVSFGVDGLQDRRDYIFERWKKEDFKRLHDLIKKGTTGAGDSRNFPPKVSEGGMGYRGEFRKEKGFWLLRYFLAGD